jgi:predicted RNA-binding protein associated with RNAse of E/G family
MDAPAAADQTWAPGDSVALREVWREEIWAARPAIVVKDEPAERMFYVSPSGAMKAPVGVSGEPLRLPVEEWRLEDRPGGRRHILSFAWPAMAHAVLASWRAETGEFTGWYVNLQDPLRPSAVGFDTTDHVLDVLVPPDRSSWRWKDEDEMVEAVRRGLFDAEQVERFRQEGARAAERLIGRDPPFDLPWESWRPDPGWPSPELPADWATAPGASCSDSGPTGR